MSGRLHAPVALAPGKEPPRYLLDGRLGGFQSGSERCREDKNLLHGNQAKRLTEYRKHYHLTVHIPFPTKYSYAEQTTKDGHMTYYLTVSC
jgi:hypothetical protein